MVLIHTNKKVDIFLFRPSFRKAGNRKTASNINMNFILLASEKYPEKKVPFFTFSLYSKGIKKKVPSLRFVLWKIYA